MARTANPRVTESTMIDLYYWTSPNVHKITMFLEETGLPFHIIPIDVTHGEQYEASFTSLSPNNRIPVIVDRDPAGGGEPITIFESGAILLYLAEKAGELLAHDIRVRMATLQWLFWQIGGLGPMGGQCVHFRNYAPRRIEYALQRYGAENDRLIGVLDRHLQAREYIAEDYSIADIACYPWIFAHDRRQQIDFAPFPNVHRWYKAIADRSATRRAYAWVATVTTGPNVTAQQDLSVEARRILFGAHAV